MTQAIVELLKLSIGVYFSIAKMNNATEEELDAIYQEEKGKFANNDPSKLEDV
ncbi:MAG: hypothetical protein GY853_10030 [PVC group bacterium]|nr:hypothetical protein [PVC group bacterium]